MVDDVLVELVGRHVLLGRLEVELVARDEPEQIALATAVRAVALLDFREIAFDFKRDATAVTAS